MFFEKKSFFYWLDDGIVEMSVESNTKGKWRTLDNNKSAQGKTSFLISHETSSFCTYFDTLAKCFYFIKALCRTYIVGIKVSINVDFKVDSDSFLVWKYSRVKKYS